jgi:rhodanese-related sulfurtransferase
MSDNQAMEPIRISVEEAKKRFDAKTATILDVVDTDVYRRLSYRIQGAERINPEYLVEEFSRLPKDRAVLAY